MMDLYVDEIEAIRKHNNSLWMDLLRIALKYGEGKEILRKIVENDKQITRAIEGLLDEGNEFRSLDTD